MARIKIDIPANIIARIQVTVRITDINYGNHLGNDALVGILHEARVNWLKKHGFNELNVAGTGLIMADLAVEYLSESFYADELCIDMAAGEISRVGFELYYLLQTTRNEKAIVIAKAKTGMICYDYANKKIQAVPEALKQLLMTPTSVSDLTP